MSLDVNVCDFLGVKLLILTFTVTLIILIKSGQYLAIIYRITVKTSKKVFFIGRFKCITLT